MVSVLCSSISVAAAATFNVSSLTEIQNALTTAAANGENDTINVASGTYNLSTGLTFNSSENFSLTITGTGKSSTYLYGGNTVQILSITTTQNSAAVTIQDMTFRNSTTTDNGGALSVTSVGGNITLDDCEVADSSATSNNSVGGGASLATDTGTITVSSCEFLRNSSNANVGGLYVGTVTGTLQLTNCTFEENSVVNTGGSVYFGDGGGAMFYSDSTSQGTIQGNFFTSNSASGGSNPDGGGLMTYQLGANSVLTLDNNSFSGNTAGLGGGGCILRFNAGGVATVSNNTFSANQSSIGSGAGAMVYIDSGTLTYSGNTHTNNISAEYGGGAWINFFAGNATISNNVFSANQASQNGGGLSLVTETATVSVERNIFYTNQAGNVGGGFSYATNTGSLNSYNNTFYNNTASANGGGIYLYLDQDTASSTINNNILWHDTPEELEYSFGSGSAAVTMTYSDAENSSSESWFGTGCISDDPLFVNPTEGDLALKWQNYPLNDATKSPCIDNGDPGSTVDTDTTQADMGAFAFLQSQPSVTISNITMTYPMPLQTGDPVGVTVNAVAADSSQLYYKFYYCANYGTAAYDTSPWIVAQAYSTSNRATFNFDTAGSYVIVVRVVTNPANEPAALPIIGGVVNVEGDSNSVNLISLSSDNTGTIAAGTPVTFSASSKTTAGDTMYYQFYYCADYGTTEYDTSPWIITQTYSTNNQATFSFPEAGNYIVVVRAVTDPSSEPTNLPIIGNAVTIE